MPDVDSSPTTILSVCAGAGGLDLGLQLALGNARTVCFVENDAYACEVLASRMAEDAVAEAPIWTDIRTFDGRPWRGVVDIVAAGFPCQPASAAGRRLGVEDDRWLWPEIARVVREVRPGWVFLENVRGLLSANDGAAFGEILGDLARLGFDAEWGVFSAAEAGAPHRRERVFVLAHMDDTNSAERRQPPGRRSPPARLAGETMGHAARLGRREGRAELAGRVGLAPPTLGSGTVADSTGSRREEAGRGREEHARGELEPRRSDVADPDRAGRSGTRLHVPERGPLAPVSDADRAGGAEFPPGPDDAEGWRAYLQRWPGLKPAISYAETFELEAQSGFRGGPYGSANRMDRLRLCGNGVVPQCAALAFRELAARFGDALT